MFECFNLTHLSPSIRSDNYIQSRKTNNQCEIETKQNVLSSLYIVFDPQVH